MKRSWFVFLLSAICSPAIFAASVTLTAVEDTTIFIGAVNPGSFNGVDFVAGETPQGGTAHALLRFNVTSIPADAVIDSASVSLTVTKKATPATVAHSYGLFRLLRAWTESEASWTAASSTEAWSNAGGDCESDASGDAPFDIGAGTLASAKLAADVQGWVNGSAPNSGWLLRETDASTGVSGRRFASHEASDPETQPKLTITYHVPAPEPKVVILNPTHAQGMVRFDFQASAGKTYTVEYLDVIGPLWKVLTNVTVQSASLANISDVMTNSQRFYRVSTPSPIP